MAGTAAKALKVEATEEVTDLKVEFRGHTYTLPRDSQEWDIEVMEAMEDGKPVTLVRGLLGAEQWAQVKGTGLKMKDFDELADAFLAAVGLSMGKSES